jgi:LmbE family N-acetylglucosaminyl deacetylase
MIQPKRVLVLAPHTDDGELGCGSTIHKFIKEGADVYYAAFSICTRSLPAGMDPLTLEREVKAATKILGIKPENLILFDYDVRHFPANRQPILEEMVKINREVKPDLVLLPNSNDIHQDHKVIADEGLRAFKQTTLLGYELPWNSLTFTTSCFIKLEEAHVAKKIEALKEYKSQAHRTYLNEAFIRGWALTRGTQVGSEFAEAFEVIRLIV